MTRGVDTINAAPKNSDNGSSVCQGTTMRSGIDSSREPTRNREAKRPQVVGELKHSIQTVMASLAAADNCNLVGTQRSDVTASEQYEWRGRYLAQKRGLFWFKDGDYAVSR